MHLGTQELILILLIAIVLFGGKKVAGLGKALGTSLREFRAEVRKDDEPSSGQSETQQTETQRTETPPMNQPIRQRKKRKLHPAGRLLDI